ncbi:MAG TPA: FHA domain-containing protein, partial [Ilumatobacteraceae bacterium]|nr:FHA domain-containing protein [Ilumatobacteraceae bacterium]
GAPPPVATPAPRREDTAAEDHHDPDVTLPPPVSDELLADVRRDDTADSRSSLVEAKLCADGHANPPTAATCAVCAQFLAPGSSAVVHVPRPSLGQLQLDDGELIELDQELLVGRNPDRDDEPARASMRRVKTLGEKVSRSHLEVRFQGWDVLVADAGSTNGTFVVPHPGGQVAALEPGRPQMIDPGAVVYFGSRSFTLLGREGLA